MNEIIIYSGIGVIILFLLIIIFLIIRSRRKIVVLSDRDLKEEQAKRVKIRGILSDASSSMLENDYSRAKYNYKFANELYKSMKTKDRFIEKGLRDLYDMLPKK